MKTQKNKIVFVLVMVSVVLFITVYALVTFGKEKKAPLKPDRIPVPKLDGKTVEYDSKMDALDDLKEEQEHTAPPIYPEHMVDGKGYFNPDYMEYEKQRIIDSMGRSKKFVKMTIPLQQEEAPISKDIGPVEENENIKESKQSVSPQDLALNHQLFFSSRPETIKGTEAHSSGFLAYVDGYQTVRTGHRLQMRLAQDIEFDGYRVPKGSPIYGFVTLAPNRVMVDISRLGPNPVRLRVHDHQDGMEGIYMENHLGGELLESGMEATLGQVNLPGFPQVKGIGRIFRRNNRAIKVALADNHLIHLKQ